MCPHLRTVCPDLQTVCGRFELQRRKVKEFVERVICEDRVLDGPASGETGTKGGPYMYCNPRT